MNYFVARHDIGYPPDENAGEEAKENREAWSEKLERSPGTARMALSSLWLDVVFCLHGDPEAQWLDTWEATAMAMQMHHAVLLSRATPRGEQIEVMVDHHVRVVEAVGPDSALNASTWTTAFFLAAVCRDQGRLDQLCDIPVDDLREAGESDGTQYNAFTYRWVGALQAFIKGQNSVFGDELLAAMELSQPDTVSFGDPGVLNRLVFPPMDALLRLAERDGAAFNESLARALGLFREHQVAESERRKDVEGLLPLSLLGIACWAWDLSVFDSEFSFEVDSGYLPKHLLEGSWRGEFAI